MSLQDLQLPASLITELYADCLIEPTPGSMTMTESKKTTAKGIAFLGGNAKNIAIFINEGSQAYMNDDELLWLQKMLNACKLTLGDVAIVNIHSQKPAIAEIKKELAPRKVLLLGPSPADLQLPLNFPQFKIQEHDQCAYVYAPSAKELNQETSEGKLNKTKLWVTLQKLFEV